MENAILKLPDQSAAFTAESLQVLLGELRRCTNAVENAVKKSPGIKPTLSPTDDHCAIWLGVHIRLGSPNEKLSKLFFLLADRLGYDVGIEEIQRAIDGMETSYRIGSPSIDRVRSWERIRKLVSRIRRKLRATNLNDGKMSDHLRIIVATNKRGYSMHAS